MQSIQFVKSNLRVKKKAKSDNIMKAGMLVITYKYAFSTCSPFLSNNINFLLSGKKN